MVDNGGETCWVNEGIPSGVTLIYLECWDGYSGVFDIDNGEVGYQYGSFDGSFGTVYSCCSQDGPYGDIYSYWSASVWGC